MSEYWKSTPKYWCKFCQLFVRDTSLEKKQHESTPKHQNSIQRSLRELHKGKEREDREKQRAKDEVARLKGQAPRSSGTKLFPFAGAAATAAAGTAGSFSRSGAVANKATPEERKRQMEQLAAMGVAVPDEYRRDMAVASEWQTVSERPIYSRPVEVKSEAKQEEGEEKPAIGSFGVRKRKMDEREGESGAQAAESAERRKWGSSLRTYPGAAGAVEEEDLDALLAVA